MEKFKRMKQWVAVIVVAAMLCTGVLGQIGTAYAAKEDKAEKETEELTQETAKTENHEQEVKTVETEIEEAQKKETPTKETEQTEAQTEKVQQKAAEERTKMAAEAETGVEREQDDSVHTETEGNKTVQSVDGMPKKEERNQENENNSQNRDQERESEEKSGESENRKISGKIIEVGTSSPIDKATVQLKGQDINGPEGMQSPEEILGTTETDDQGSFKIPFPEKEEDIRYWIEVSKEGYVIETREWQFGEQRLSDIKLAREVEIKITLVDGYWKCSELTNIEVKVKRKRPEENWSIMEETQPDSNQYTLKLKQCSDGYRVMITAANNYKKIVDFKSDQQTPELIEQQIPLNEQVRFKVAWDGTEIGEEDKVVICAREEESEEYKEIDVVQEGFQIYFEDEDRERSSLYKLYLNDGDGKRKSEPLCNMKVEDFREEEGTLKTIPLEKAKFKLAVKSWGEGQGDEKGTLQWHYPSENVDQAYGPEIENGEIYYGDSAVLVCNPEKENFILECKINDETKEGVVDRESGRIEETIKNIREDQTASALFVPKSSYIKITVDNGVVWYEYEDGNQYTLDKGSLYNSMLGANISIENQLIRIKTDLQYYLAEIKKNEAPWYNQNTIPIEKTEEGSFEFRDWKNGDTFEITIENDTVPPSIENLMINKEEFISKWRNEGFSLSIIASDLITKPGNLKVYYYADNKIDETKEAESNQNGEFTISIPQENMECRYTIYARDLAGNESDKETVLIQVDKDDPEISIIEKEPDDEWTNEEHVKVNLVAQDNLSGIACGYYMPRENETEKKIIDISSQGNERVEKQIDDISYKEGRNDFKFWVEDKAGNQSEEREVVVKIDTHPPVINSIQAKRKTDTGREDFYRDESGRAWSSGDIEVSVDVLDVVPEPGNIEVSGIKCVYISDKYPEDTDFNIKEHAKELIQNPDGEDNEYIYTIEKKETSFKDQSYYIWAVDKAGNKSEIQETKFSMDVREPQVQPILIENDLNASKQYPFGRLDFAWFGSNVVKLRVYAEDEENGSGVSSIQLFILGKGPEEYVTLTDETAVTKIQDGDSIRYYADFILPVNELVGPGDELLFKEKIYAMARDYTEHESSKVDTKEIILEQNAPKVEISLKEAPQYRTFIEGKSYACFSHDTSLSILVRDDLDTNKIYSGVKTVQVFINAKLIRDKLYEPERPRSDSLEISTQEVPIDENGSYHVVVSTEDWSGNKTVERYTLYKDIHSPRIGKLSKLPSSAWSPGRVIVTASDVLDSEVPFCSGIREVRYSTDETGRTYQLAFQEASKENTFSFEVNDESERTYYLWAVDNVGNISPARSIKVRIDKTAPQIQRFTFQPEHYQESSGESLKKATAVTNYGFYFKNAATVTILATDLIKDQDGVNKPSSGVEYISYYGVDENGETTIRGKKRVDSKNSIQFSVKRNFKGRIYAKPIDAVGNMPKDNPETPKIDEGYVQTDAVIIEDAAKHAKTSQIVLSLPETEQRDVDGRRLYSRDVSVDITVRDTYSGIRSIEWTVESPYDTRSNQSGRMDINNKKEVTGDSGGWSISETDRNLITEMKQSLSVSNDSNDITVTVKLTDRAGNTSSQNIQFSIDKTAPEIEVTYDNQNYDLEFASEREYYKEARRATITVTERNFSQENVILSVTNAYGSIPGLSGWTEQVNQQNPDETTHTATLFYQEDGAYRFDIACTDLANNQAGEYQGDSFIVDLTPPRIEISYDNQQSQNGNYYKEGRTATITIREKNFETSRIYIAGTASDNGKEKKFPQVSGWSSQGEDVHTATISFEEDARYALSVKYTDKAGNPEEAVQTDEFYVDKTAPDLQITGVEDRSANNGKVNLTVTWSDTNYGEQAKIKLKGANRGKVDLIGEYKEISNGSSFVFDDFEYVQETDDIYTLEASVVDLAGNSIQKELTFSVNRFGSVYTMEKETKGVEGKYISQERDIVLTETNVDSLPEDSIRVKVSRNGMITDLKKGEDYFIEREGGEGSWTRYQYTIPSNQFKEEGRYIVTVSSKDAAGNINENGDETKKAEIRFGIDKTEPTVVSLNLESNTTYPEDSKTARIDISDNLVMAQVLIQLNGTSVETEQDEQGAYLVPLKNEDHAQSISITAVDAAGNIRNVVLDHFYITTNLFIRWYTNRRLVSITLMATAVLAIGGMGILLFGSRRRKRRQIRSLM